MHIKFCSNAIRLMSIILQLYVKVTKIKCHSYEEIHGYNKIFAELFIDMLLLCTLATYVNATNAK